MALPPTIPTSFVPHFNNAQSPRARFESAGMLAPLAYGFFGIVVILAISVFFYERVLNSAKLRKETELKSAQAAIDPATIESFVRLNNRLESSKQLISAHPAFSSLLVSIEKTLPTKTRFTALRFSIQEGGSARIDGTGIANNFNALAVTSQALAREGKIKDAVFSNIRVTRENAVSFSLSAKAEQKDFAFKVEESVTPAEAQTLP